jgi:hypothetical protein
VTRPSVPSNRTTVRACSLWVGGFVWSAVSPLGIVVWKVGWGGRQFVRLFHGFEDVRF